MQVINDIFLTRKESGEKHEDFLNTMLGDDIFNKKSALHHIFTVPVIAKDTTSIVTCLAVKFIAENPKVLAKLKVIYTQANKFSLKKKKRRRSMD